MTGIGEHLKNTYRKETHENAEANNNHTRDPQDLLSSCLGVDVLSVDVISNKRRYSNTFSTSSRHDSHKQHDQYSGSSWSSHQMVGDSGRNKTRAGFAAVDRKHKSSTGQSQRSGQRERDGEPANSSEQVATSSTCRPCSNSRLPVRLVDEDGTKVTDNVDDTEHETIAGKHGEVRPSVVATNSTTCHRLSAIFEIEGGISSSICGPVSFTLFSSVGNGLVQVVIDLIGRVDLDIPEIKVAIR